ncbi:hypothetical protein [Paenibacillus hamazuiensis]|uniref:hypothetical protein n=1 Tax=Paenibacillus hamazuiensis TaxID=2936508 RepID=UPI00200CF007|nr:hypothetical protein [Paenibacillus hamazuiensis]
MKQLTAADLRGIVSEIMEHSMEQRRKAVSDNRGGPDRFIEGEPTDREIDEFIAGNPYLDEEIIGQLLDPGSSGYSGIIIFGSEEELIEFRKNILAWSMSGSWLGGK